MLIYIQGGDNYVEASAGFRDSFWYAAFFIFCTVVGLFFITSLLIEAFCGSYEADQSCVHALRKQSERRSLVIVLLIWARHSYHSVAIYGATRNVNPSLEYTAYSEEGLTLDAFVDLITNDAFTSLNTLNKLNTGWGASLQRTLRKLVRQLEAAAPIQPGSMHHQVVIVLLDLCAEASSNDMYIRLDKLTHLAEQPLAARREELVMTMHITASAHRSCTCEQIGWLRGRSPEDSELERALATLPQLKGLELKQPSSKADTAIYVETCRLLRLMHLHKWCIHRTFMYMDTSGDHVLQHHEFEQVCRLCATMDKLANSKILRLEAYRVAIERQMQQLQINGEDVNVDRVEAEHRCLQHAGLIGNELLFDRQVQEAHTVFSRHATKGSKPKNVQLDILPLALADGLFPWHIDSVTIKQKAEEIISNSVDAGVLSVDFTKYVHFRQDLRELLANTESMQYQAHIQGVFHLSREHSRLLDVIKLVKDLGVFGEADVTFVFHLISWSHVVLLSQYHSGTDLNSVDTFDHVCAAFALMPWIEVCIHIYQRGPHGYFLFQGGATETLYVYGTLVCIFVGLIGVIVMELEWFDVVGLGTARFIMSFSTLTIFTQNIRFSQLLQTIGTVSSAAWPIVTSLIAIACLYARAAHDLFGDKAANRDGLATTEPFFETYKRALSTFFRLFLGEGWTAVMYSASNATTEGARVFFVTFTLLCSLLFAQLIIGVIVNLFTDVQRLNSEQLYSCLSEFTDTANRGERGAIEDDVLLLNTTMLPLHEALDMFGTDAVQHLPSFDKNGKSDHIFFRSLPHASRHFQGKPSLREVVAEKTG